LARRGGRRIDEAERGGIEFEAGIESENVGLLMDCDIGFAAVAGADDDPVIGIGTFDPDDYNRPAG
jgi:hypothetical protein